MSLYLNLEKQPNVKSCWRHWDDSIIGGLPEITKNVMKSINMMFLYP